MTNQLNLDFSLPDIGVSGSATTPQKKAVCAIFDWPDASWLSNEQAGLFLAVRDYVTVVCERRLSEMPLETRRTPAAKSLLPITMILILQNEETVQAIQEWSERRFVRGTHNNNPRILADEKFDAVNSALEQAVRIVGGGYTQE